MSATKRSPSWLRWWLVGYAVLVGVVISGMLWQRQSILAQFSTPEALAEWRAWREDVRKQQAAPGPVERKVPKSEEPPALVLMRDYFGVSISGALFFSSLLYFVLAWFVTGALRSR